MSAAAAAGSTAGVSAGGLAGLRGLRKRASSSSIEAEAGGWSTATGGTCGTGNGSPDDVCQTCFGKFRDDANGEEWIQCLSCRSWYHATCQGLQAYLSNFQCLRCKPPQPGGLGGVGPGGHGSHGGLGPAGLTGQPGTGV